MRQNMVAVALACALQTSTAQAQSSGDPSRGLIDAQSVCAACHGVEAISPLLGALSAPLLLRGHRATSAR